MYMFVFEVKYYMMKFKLENKCFDDLQEKFN